MKLRLTALFLGVCLCVYGHDFSKKTDLEETISHYSDLQPLVLETPGCVDPLALNYDPLADEDCQGAIGATDTSCCIYPPVNDECLGATAVSCGDVISGSTETASVGDEVMVSSCGPSLDGPGVWYTILGDGSEITATTCGSTYDSRVHVFSGSCGNYVCEGSNDDGDCNGIQELQSTVTWITFPGIEYYIHVSGWNGGIGDFDIAFTCEVASCTLPLNDQCINATSLADGMAAQGSNGCAQANDIQPSCDPFASISGVWYIWNSGTNNALSLDFSAAVAPVDSAADSPSIAIFSGNCMDLEELFCSNTAVVNQSVLDLSPATDYYLMVWTGVDADEGEFDLLVTGGGSGCTTEGACNYDEAATVEDESCDLSCIGCTNQSAVNYSAAATTDDGSCIISPCEDEPISYSMCYENNTEDVIRFQEVNPGEGVVIRINSGTVEVYFDEFYVYDGLDSTFPQLNTEVYGNGGDFSGEVYQSTGSDISIQVVSDGSVSCNNGNQDEFDIDVFCGQLAIIGCMDPFAVNYNPDATIDDGCHANGCADPAACNFNPQAVTDDGTCCLENCVTITITDSFGDGGTSIILFDDQGSQLTSLSLDDGTEISNEFCIPNGCYSLSIETDAFPQEASIVMTSSETIIYEAQTGSITEGSVEIVDLFGDCFCSFSCGDECALNYDSDQSCDCFGVVGGSDMSCCIFPVENNECSGSIELVDGELVSWESYLSSNSGNNCSPTLFNDVWFSYTPECDVEVDITSDSNQGGELAVWEGTCPICGEEGVEELTLVECFPNGGFTAVEGSVVLSGGVTYYIQTGSNSTFGFNSEGTIELTSSGCRGCIYNFAANYDPMAEIDDGSCIEEENSCPGDFTGDGFITVSDLTGFLAAFGQACD